MSIFKQAAHFWSIMVLSGGYDVDDEDDDDDEDDYDDDEEEDEVNSQL